MLGYDIKCKFIKSYENIMTFNDFVFAMALIILLLMVGVVFDCPTLGGVGGVIVITHSGLGAPSLAFS